MEYEERMEVLREVEYPKPLADFLYEVFDVYRVRHPWARDYNVHPKSIVRDMYERSMGFSEYVAHYGLARSEGLLLRYLSDAYKALVQNVPEDDQVAPRWCDITEWLGEMVRQVDSSLLDEWELLTHPDEIRGGRRPGPAAGCGPAATTGRRALTAQPAGLSGHGPQRLLPAGRAGRPARLGALEELDQGEGWDAARWEAAFEPYFDEHASIGTGADARGPQLWQVTEGRPSLAGAPGARRPRRLPRVGHRPGRGPRRLGPPRRGSASSSRRRARRLTCEDGPETFGT